MCFAPQRCFRCCWYAWRGKYRPKHSHFTILSQVILKQTGREPMGPGVRKWECHISLWAQNLSKGVWALSLFGGWKKESCGEFQNFCPPTQKARSNWNCYLWRRRYSRSWRQSRRNKLSVDGYKHIPPPPPPDFASCPSEEMYYSPGLYLKLWLSWSAQL